MNTGFNITFLIISILLLLTLNIWVSLKLKKSKDAEKVKLSSFWFLGFFFIIIGICFQYLNLSIIYEEIAQSDVSEDFVSKIKVSLIVSISYITLFILAIISYYIQKIKRQNYYNIQHPI